MKPLIGIMAKTYRDNEWSPPFNGQRSGYADGVIAAGGIPVIVPLTTNQDVLRATFERLDGILLAGGGDIDPARYGQAKFERHDAIDRIMAIDPLRDSCEIAMLRWAIHEAKPTLGICRGMQLINVVHGGDMYQDIAAQTPSTVDHLASLTSHDWQLAAHSVRFAPATQLGKAMGGEPLQVNSLHHQAVRTLGAGLTPAGWSEDGLLEALEGPACWGVQFHPEELVASDPAWTALFELFVTRAGSHHRSATV